jgi:hypothetical protein
MMTEGGRVSSGLAKPARRMRKRSTCHSRWRRRWVLRTRGFALESMLETRDDGVSRTARELTVQFIDCDDERFKQRYIDTRQPPTLPATGP